MKIPKIIVETVGWVVDGDPVMCQKCEHLHYPRRPVSTDPMMNRTWAFCEGDECHCRRLYENWNNVAG